MSNEDIRIAAKSAGVKLWEIAEAFGLNDGNFSRKLRRELSDADRERIMGIIHEIAGRRERD